MLNGARDPRGNGRTFSPEHLGWLDFETRSGVDLGDVGAMVYANHPTTTALILVFAIGDGPVHRVVVRKFGTATLAWEDMPIELLRHHAKVMAGNAVWAAWNAGFDRATWNYTCEGFPELEPHMIIDVMAQATANGLPPDLAMASRLSHSVHKVADGKDLIKRFCIINPPPNAKIQPGTPQTHPEEWARFIDYAAGDILAMRSVFNGTRQLPYAEWQEYWAGERVNDRGIAIDVPMARAAAAIALEDKKHSGLELQKLTGGAVQTVGQVQAIMNWLIDRLPAEGRAILVSREQELDDDGELVRPAKMSLKRNRIEKLLAYCRDRGGLETEERVLEIRRFGGSTTPAKFQKMLDQNHDGALYGSYVFNGAAQTGRYSSRGVQIHNLTRDFLPYEQDAIETLLADDASHAKLSQLNFGAEPVSRKLSLLVRPTLVARPGKTFVWSDWANIEARVLPWLAGDHPGARERLEIFRAVDADPTVPDLYTRTAAKLSRIPIEEVTKATRQRGKVAELALGFGGGVGALQAMGAGYGLYFNDADAKTVVDTWRYENQWCVQFWGKHDKRTLRSDDGPIEVVDSYGLWGAALTALGNPHHITTAGRIRFMYVPELMKSLLMFLPSGRFLTYRDIRFESVADLDEDDNIIGYSTKLRFHKGYGRSVIWHGTFCENAVQATAADILRGTLVRLDERGEGATAHTHDEVLLEVDEGTEESAKQRLAHVMRKGFTWSAGLPIMSDEETGFYYSKWEGK